MMVRLLGRSGCPHRGMSHACSSADARALGISEAVSGDWRIETQAGSDIDPQRLCDLIDRIAVINANIHCVLIVRHGALVFEHYRSGPDEQWGLGDGRRGAPSRILLIVAMSVITIIGMIDIVMLFYRSRRPLTSRGAIHASAL